MSASLTGRERAAESVAERFTRIMRASVSPYGVLTDPPLVCFAIALIGVPAVLLRAWRVGAAAALPLAIAVLANFVALRGARDRVIDWLASLPFPVENMNALLNGVGQALVVELAGSKPDVASLDEPLTAIDDNCFAMPYEDDASEIQIQLGIVDSKINPAGAHHRRYRRVRVIVEDVLVPLAKEHRIERVRIA